MEENIFEKLTDEELKVLLKAFKILETTDVNLRLSVANIEELAKEVYIKRVMTDLVGK